MQRFTIHFGPASSGMLGGRYGVFAVDNESGRIASRVTGIAYRNDAEQHARVYAWTFAVDRVPAPIREFGAQP